MKSSQSKESLLRGWKKAGEINQHLHILMERTETNVCVTKKAVDHFFLMDSKDILRLLCYKLLIKERVENRWMQKDL